MLKRKNYLMSKAFEATIIFIVFILLFVFKLNANPAPPAKFKNETVIQRDQQIRLALPNEHKGITTCVIKNIENKMMDKRTHP